MNVVFSTAFFAQCVNHMVMLGGLSIDPVLPSTGVPGTSSENALFAAEIEADTQVIASNVGESKVHNITKAAAVSAAVNLSKPQVPGQPPKSPGKTIPGSDTNNNPKINDGTDSDKTDENEF